MCGITGIYNFHNQSPVNKSVLKEMTEMVHHRGPDDDGYYCSNGIGLGQRRLSIIDIEGGKQPVYNEDKTIWVIFNGEIFNYIELREFLVSKGHRFYSKSDTEVIVHAYEEFGNNFLFHLNGQFAIAIWDEKLKKLFLARDRVGIRPLFYSVLDGKTLLFGSEMKSILKYPNFQREIDVNGLNQIYTYWVNIPPRTVFKNINELPAGNYLVCTKDSIKVKEYWNLNYPPKKDIVPQTLQKYKEQLSELLYDATTIRLRADVPVAAYLSGGIDSSIISTLVKKYHNNDLITFSVSFSDEDYDERKYQNQMVQFLKTNHREIEATYVNIGQSFKDVVWFAEKPMIRTAPAPLFLLSKLVRDSGIKVVLTGEGADEVFGGYNIFKEDKIRRFWAKQPDSKLRPLLLTRLYPYIQKGERQSNAFWQQFFKKNLLDVKNPYYSHLIRWENTGMIRNYLRKDSLINFSKVNYENELNGFLGNSMMDWDSLARAQYMEMKLFMSGYLLSSQGDRMMMGNSVEGRFPYLDHRILEFSATIPPYYKIRGLNEKYLLKKTYQDLIPLDIIKRNKQPYRAPITQCFLDEQTDPLYTSLLDNSTIEKYGYFDSHKVGNLVDKLKKFKGQNISARDDMTIVSIISTQLLHYQFIENFN
jgi:asparagine synthase (glutamine-hydrolysing)